MRRVLAAAAAGAAVALALAAPALATEDKTIPVESNCLTGWYVNPDEGGTDQAQGDRRPTSTADGLVFKDNQLVHHATDLPVADLKPGTYVADPAPTSPSFFSVEVWGNDGTGYGTLRWVDADDLWSLTTGGQTYTDTDPANLVADHDKATTVRSFGVGYTNAPRDYPETTVSSVTFAGETYDLTCKPSPSPSVKPSPSKTAPAGGVPTTTAPTTGGQAATLPVTGSPVGTFVAVAAGVLLLGTVALLVSRRRRTRFTA